MPTTFDLYTELYSQADNKGLMAGGERKYFMDYHHANNTTPQAEPGTNTVDYQFDKRHGSQYAKGLIFYHWLREGSDETLNRNSVRVFGSVNQDIFIPAKDVTDREELETLDKSLLDTVDIYTEIAALTEGDIILLPFNSDRSVYWNENESVIYTQTPAGRIDKLVKVPKNTPEWQLKGSLAFLDTFEMDLITTPFDRALVPHEIKGSNNNEQDPVTGAPWFVISKPERFRLSNAARIQNFKSDDVAWIDSKTFGKDDLKIAIARTKKNATQLARQSVDLIYDQRKQALYFNENGIAKGFGRGGLVAIFENAPVLDMDHFLVV